MDSFEQPDNGNMKGGTFTQPIDEVKDTLHKLQRYYNIFNTDILLKIMTTFHYKLYTNFLTVLFKEADTQSRDEFSKLFFVIINEKYLILPGIENILGDMDKFTKLYTRDTHFINKNIVLPENQSKKYIFGYNLVKILISQINDDELSPFNTNDKAAFLLNLFTQLFANITKIYTFLETGENKNNISQFFEINYSSLFSNSTALTYVKVRNDTSTSIGTQINPRYLLNIQETDKSNVLNHGKYILMRYNNIDKHLGTDHNKSAQPYPELEYTNNIKSDQPIEKIFTLDNIKSEPRNVTPSTPLKLTPEYFYSGPFNDVFDAKISNSKAAESLIPLMNNLMSEDPSPMCIIGYGQSGAGKTASLIYLNKGGDSQDGIIMNLCNNNKVGNKYKRIELLLCDLFVFFDDRLNSIEAINKNKHYYDYWISGIDPKEQKKPNEPYVFIYVNGTWVYEPDANAQVKRTLGVFISAGFELREVNPTPNNPNSSRSHVIVCATLIPKDNNMKPARIAVCDLAGVENVFNCEDKDVIDMFDFKYYEESDIYNIRQTKTATGDRNEKYFDDINKHINFGEDYIKRQSNSLTKSLTHNGITKDGYSTLDNTLMNANYKVIKQMIQDESDNIKKLLGLNEDPFVMENITKGLTSMLKTGDVPIAAITTANIAIPTTQTAKKPPTGKPSTTNKTPGAKIGGSDFLSSLKAISKIGGAVTNIIDTSYPLKCREYGGKLYLPVDFNPKILEDIAKLNKQKEVINTFISTDLNTFQKGTYFSDIKNYEILYKLIPQIKPFGQKYMIASGAFATFQKAASPILVSINKQIDANKSTLESATVTLYNNACTKIRREMLKFNCKMRVMEGYMINATLKELRDDIKKITTEAIKIEGYNPIMYFKPNLPYVKNNAYAVDNYLQFTQIQEQVTEYGMLIEMLRDNFGFDVSKLKFVVFNVINLSNYQKVNNSPNPPFININDLKMYSTLFDTYNGMKMTKEIDLVTDNMSLQNFEKYLGNYSFYSNNKEITNTKSIVNIPSKMAGYIKAIEPNNFATLLGTLYATNMINDPFTTYYLNGLYSDEMKQVLTDPKNTRLNKLLNSINDINKDVPMIAKVNEYLDKIHKSPSNYDLIARIKNKYMLYGENEMKAKYMKYKNKYLELKNRQ